MDQIQLMAQYNLWADKIICERISQLDEALFDLDQKSSFPTIRKTLGHMFDAERIWLHRLNGRSLEHWPSSKIPKFTVEHLIEESMGVLEYVQGLHKQEINSLCSYSNRNGEQFENTVGEILMHLFNHATYHRGQLITMLREVGEENLPSTDLISYLRIQSS